MNTNILRKDIRDLSYVYPLAVDDDFKSLLIQDFNLPPGYNFQSIRVLIDLPDDYPENPPGVGASSVYVPTKLRYQGKVPDDFHKHNGPSNDWAWWCYERIDWDPCKDNLITFCELLRAHMTNPKTKGTLSWLD